MHVFLLRMLAILSLTATWLGSIHADDNGWIDLAKDLAAWDKPSADWRIVGGVELDPQNPKRLTPKPGAGIMINGPRDATRDLLSKEKFGDIELHLEFFIPKGSNSGVKVHGHYEIQIADSWGKKEPTAGDCGGIYPRAELQPKYHHIDKGFPPRTNACRPPGEWQSLDIVFTAPRFDAAGKKTTHAKFVKVVLNGKVIHENVEVPYPTGHAWHNPEVATGPLLLQSDHGFVAFRNIRLRPLK